MITVSDAVNSILKKSFFYEEALSQDFANLSAIARKLKPQIEEIISRRVKEGAIIMALKRWDKHQYQTPQLQEILKKQPEIFVRSNLVEFVISNSKLSTESLGKLLKFSETGNNYFLTITRGLFDTTIITSNVLMPDIEKICNPGDFLLRLERLSAITLKVGVEKIYTPGFTYALLRGFTLEKLNVIEAVSSYDEHTLILDDKDTDKAFSIIKKLFGEK